MPRLVSCPPGHRSAIRDAEHDLPGVGEVVQDDVEVVDAEQLPEPIAVEEKVRGPVGDHGYAGAEHGERVSHSGGP